MLTKQSLELTNVTTHIILQIYVPNLVNKKRYIKIETPLPKSIKIFIISHCSAGGICLMEQCIVSLIREQSRAGSSVIRLSYYFMV